MGQDAATHLGNIVEISFSYVILLPEGRFNANVDPNKIINIFGDFGPGQFAQVPNGFIVQNGPLNRLLIQVPRVEMKAANRELLLTMVTGCRNQIGNLLLQRSARAFGINNEYFLYLDNEKITSEDFLQRLGTDRLEGRSINEISLRQRLSMASDMTITTKVTLDENTPDRLVFNSNVNIKNPQNPMLTIDELEHELTNAHNMRKTFLTELTKCVEQQN